MSRVGEKNRHSLVAGYPTIDSTFNLIFSNDKLGHLTIKSGYLVVKAGIPVTVAVDGEEYYTRMEFRENVDLQDGCYHIPKGSKVTLKESWRCIQETIPDALELIPKEVKPGGGVINSLIAISQYTELQNVHGLFSLSKGEEHILNYLKECGCPEENIHTYSIDTQPRINIVVQSARCGNEIIEDRIVIKHPPEQPSINHNFEELYNTRWDKILLNGSKFKDEIMHIAKCEKGELTVVFTSSTAKYAELLLPVTSTYISNGEELGIITGIGTTSSSEPDADGILKAVKSLKKNRIPEVIVTIGERGSIGVDRENEVYLVSACKVSPCNTNGAGDAYTAGFFASSGTLPKRMVNATKVAATHLAKRPPEKPPDIIRLGCISGLRPDELEKCLYSQGNFGTQTI